MRRIGLLAAAIVLTSASWTFAQDTTRGEFSGGWRYYHASLASVPRSFEIANPNDFPKGWYGDVAFNLSPKFAVVGEGGGTYFRDHVSRTSGILTTDESLEVRRKAPATLSSRSMAAQR